jgi:hypothetical protein
MPHEVATETALHPDAPPPLRPTTGGRIAIGTVLALGLYLALRKLATGFILATHSNPDGWWVSFNGLAVIHASQAIAVLFGGLLAATGLTRGYPLGLAVGGVCGGLFLAYEILAGAPPGDLVLYMQPPVLAVIGLAAGLIGSRIWGAAPKLDMPIPNTNKLSSIRLAEDEVLNPGKPTVWVRVLLGAVIMVFGVVAAEQFRQTLQKHSGGMLKVRSVGQGEFITWQIATFAILAGGITAGAGTGAGMRHGLLAGALGGLGIFGVFVKAGGSLPPVAWWLVRLSLDEVPITSPSVITAIAGGVLLAGLVGGWLGGAMFLPLAPEHMRRRLSPSD